MKKSRKLLSVVLSVLIVLASMPVMYTATVASDIAAYSSETGTLANPTKPVSESGEYSQDEQNQLTAIHKNLNFTFYQTMDDEYFQLSQLVQMEKYCGSLTASITVLINGYGFDSDATTTGFFDTYSGTYSWTAGTSDSEATGFPGSFEAAGTAINCPDYSWNLDVVFKGAPVGKSGSISTGYTHVLDYTTDVDGTVNNYKTPITTTITVLDARQLVEKMTEAEQILANPENYTDAYVSSVQATLNSIPDDLKDFSGVYSQDVIDGYVEDLNDISKNSADYTEYNELYSKLKEMDNSKGAYTDDSFAAFKAEISDIDSKLPKNLDKTQQAIVTEATQALRDAFDKLVSTDLSTTNTGASYTTNGDDGDMSFTVDNTVFKFMQTEDSQVFEYSQMWTITRNGGNTDRNFGGMILQTADNTTACSNSTCRLNQTPSVNNTASFVSRLTSDSVATITANNETGTSVAAPEFLCWSEHTDASGTTDKDTTIIDTTGSYIGALDSNRDYAYDNNATYYLKNSPEFVGNPAGTYGEITTNYVLRTGWNYKTGGVLGIGATKNSSHIHINSTISVTDVRQLISAVEEANETLANPGTHSEEYIVALQAAVDSVPLEMLKGVEYYTQAEVDKLYNDIATVPEQVADYSEFVDVFDMMTGLNKDKYTEASWNTFIDEIYAINRELPKNLTADQQATIDEAVDSLYAAYDKLVSAHLNDDNVFTQDDLEGSLGNNPLEFSLSSTQYNFMQIADGQQFAIRTDLTVRNTKTNYNLYLRGLGLSVVTPDALASYCTSDDHCHNISNITTNHSEIVANAVTGVNALTYTDGVVVADGAGNITEHNTWVNTEGTALSSGGILIDNVKLANADSSAHAEMYYVGATGGWETNSATVDVTPVFWLGWYYVEPFLGSEEASDELYRHVHIPVNIKITDARALNALYGEVEDIVSGRTEADYTFESLVNVYNAFTAVPEDMPNGDTYYTQAEVDAQYAAFKEAYSALEEGADYSEYFKAYVEAEEIINSGNSDEYGNKLYDDATYNKLVDKVTSINNSLDKNLSATEENQATIDFATLQIREAIDAANASKYADYTALEEAIIKAEKIVAAEDGTYTEETLNELKEALKNANELSRTLSASEQETVDAMTSALEAAIAGVEFKADYSEFNDAYSQVQDIVNNPDNYTSATVEAAKNALAQADTLDKDLADTAANRQTIADATQALKDMLAAAEEKADYTDYNNAKSEADSLVNDDGNGNPVYDEDAFNAYKEAVENIDTALDKDLPAENQTTVNEATQALADLKATLENNKKADYTEFDAAKEALEEIVNAPEGTYTDETVQKAQEALDTANQIPSDMVVGENNANQDIIDTATDAMQSVIDSAEKKADYTEYDKAYEQIEEILNNPDKYTDETVQAAQDVKDTADAVGTNQPESNQSAVDSVTDAMNTVINSKVEKADYTDYNNAKSEADSLVNDDGNGNPVYDEDAFNAYKEAVENIDTALDKELPSSEQATVDNATSELENLKNILEQRKIYTVTFIGLDGETLSDVEYVNGSVFSSVTAPALPEATETTAYVGWLNGEEFMKADTVMNGDVTLTIASEFKVIVPVTDSTVVVNENGYITGVDKNTTVDAFKAELQNDVQTIVVTDADGNELAGDALVGTGAVITLISKYTTAIYESKVAVIYGDIDGDGDVDADDCALAKTASVADESYYGEGEEAFFLANDVNGDGYIDVLDSWVIGRIMRGKMTVISVA